MSIWNSIKSKL